MAGIKKGDVVVRIGHTAVNSQIDLRNAMLEYAPGTTVDVEVIRDGGHKTFQVKLQEHKELTAEEMQPQGGRSGQPRLNIPRGGFGGDGPEEFFKDFPGLRNPGSGGQPARPHTAPSNPDGKPRLGIGVGNLTDDVRHQFSIPDSAKGAVVAEVAPGSVADSLGIQPGDVIQSLGSKQINTAQDLTDAMAGIKHGDVRKIRFTQYGNGSVMMKEMDVTF
jgi:S1-C subfamily serine protease